MKHGGKKKRLGKHHSVKAWPTLREFWEELQRAKRAGEPLPAAPSAGGSPPPAVPRVADGSLPTAPRAAFEPPSPAAPGAAQNAPAAYGIGSFRSSGSGSGSAGSGGGGYGLALIAPDPASRERIRRIMQSLCEKDAERRRSQ